jgi:hypothetical protein
VPLWFLFARELHTLVALSFPKKETRGVVRRNISLTTLVFVFSFTTAFGRALPPGVKKVASMGGITEYDYPNGS